VKAFVISNDDVSFVDTEISRIISFGAKNVYVVGNRILDRIRFRLILLWDSHRIYYADDMNVVKILNVDTYKEMVFAYEGRLDFLLERNSYSFNQYSGDANRVLFLITRVHDCYLLSIDYSAVDYGQPAGQTFSFELIHIERFTFYRPGLDFVADVGPSCSNDVHLLRDLVPRDGGQRIPVLLNMQTRLLRFSKAGLEGCLGLDIDQNGVVLYKTVLSGGHIVLKKYAMNFHEQEPKIQESLGKIVQEGNPPKHSGNIASGVETRLETYRFTAVSIFVGLLRECHLLLVIPFVFLSVLRFMLRVSSD